MVVTEWSPKREKLFTRCLNSLTSNTKSHVSLHLIVDHKSHKAARMIVENIGWYKINITTYQIEDIYKMHSRTIANLQKFFSVVTMPYYSKRLFYLAPFVHKIIKENRLIILDTDILVLGDVTELYDEFNAFDSSQFWGVTFEQSPYYAKALRKFRVSNRNTVFGGYTKNGGIPGLNTGVLLVDIGKLVKDRFVQDNYLTEKYYSYLINRFEAQGELVLGDQDYLSLLYFEHPELFHVLGCGWNRQLCKYFKKDLEFGKEFDLYFECKENINILHGNCNTTIPSEYSQD